LFQHRFRNVALGERVLFDIEAQVDYLVTELRNSFTGVNRVLTNSTVTVDQASDEVVYNFEVPGAILSDGSKLPRTDPRVQEVFRGRRARSRKVQQLMGST
jgi:hypothetical protein